MSTKSTKLRRNRNRPPPDTAWVWLTREMIESEAWCSLSLAARRVIDRVMIEHMLHAGTENGNLVVTYADFEKFGIRRKSLKVAITEAVTTGLLIVTEKGRPSVGQDRWASRYALGWLPMSDLAPALNRWKGWRKPRPAAPIHGNIYSSGDSAPRENGRNQRSLGAQTPPAPRGANATGELAETLTSPGAKAPPGKMNFQRRAALNSNGRGTS